MSAKTFVILGLMAGSTIGSYIPVFFGADIFSYSSVIGGGIGGVLGIFIAYKLTEF